MTGHHYHHQAARRVIRGREREQEAIRDLVRRARRGRNGTLLIEGEPGMGKSLLLWEAARTARKEHVLVAAARGDEVSGIEPLTALLDLQPDASLPGAGGGEGEHEAAEGPPLAGALREQLERQTHGHPLLISLDDLHCAGHATLQALSLLPSRLASYPVVWLLARRVPVAGSGGEDLFDQLESHGAGRLSLGPLGHDAAGDLIADAVGATPDPGLLAMASGATGNPLLLCELIAGLIEEDAVAVKDGQAVVRSRRVPRRVRAAVRRMLRDITPRTRQLLQTTAVLGRSFGLRDAALMLGTTPAALLPSVEEAIAALLLVAGRDSLAFRHALVWQAVAADLPRPMGQALHREFGEILLARGGSAESAAAHLLSGTRTGDVAALAQLDRAAAEVLPTLPEVAADLATRADELTPSSDPRKLTRIAAATRALAAAGRLDRAAQLARSALAVPMPAVTSAGLRCALSSALVMSGQAAEALTEATAVLAEPGLPETIRTDARIVRLTALAASRDYQEAGALAAATLAALDEEPAEMAATALVVLAGVMWDEGRLSEAMLAASQAVELASGEPAGTWRVCPHLFLGARLMNLRRLDEARSVISLSARSFAALAPIQWSAPAPTLYARIALAAGQLDEAAGHAEAALRLARGPASRPPAAMARAVLATVSMRRGDLRAAAGQVQDGRSRHRRAISSPPDTWDWVVAAQVREALDGPAAAVKMIKAAYDGVGAHRFLLMSDPACAAWLVRTALAAGDRGRAEAVSAAAGEIAGRNPELTVPAAAAAHAGGLLDRDPGRLGFAASRHPDQWARASAAEDLAAVERERDGSRRAVERLDQALEDYEGSGAVRDAARVRQRLRRLGVRRGHWAAVSRPVSGWGSLTATERTISDLIAEGLTNRQAAERMFISVHTVAFHLRQVFRKLGISSRVELARIAVEQAPPSLGPAS